MFRSIWARVATVFAILFVLFTIANIIIVTSVVNLPSIILNIILPVDAFFLLALVFAAYFVSRTASIPVKRLTEIFNKSKDGVFDEQFDIKTIDEMGNLADAYNRAKSRLKQKLVSLTDERDEMSTILARMNDGIIVIDENKNIALINNAACRMFNVEEEKAVGHTLIEIIMDYEINNLVQQSIRDQKPHTGTIIAGPMERL